MDPEYKWRDSSERFLNNHRGLFKHTKLKEIVHLKCLMQCWHILSCQTRNTHTHTTIAPPFLFFDYTDYIPWVISQLTLLIACKESKVCH